MTALFVRLQNTTAEAPDERGAAMVEYGLLLVLVALVAVAILAIFGGTLSELFDTANETLENSPALTDGAGGETGTNE